MSTTDIQGVIEKMHTKSGAGKNGPWTKYSAVINDGWVNFGFEDPGYQEGDEVKVRCEENQYGMEVKQHKLIAKATAASKAATASGGNNSAGQAWGNASNVAASLLVTLKDLDALPITAAQGKANKAKRFDETMEIFDKLRVKLFNDSLDPARVLDMVEDFGEVEPNEPQPLPDGDVEEEEEEEDDF
jgi:hypothetical protein